MSIAQIAIESFLDRKLAQPHTPQPPPETRSLARGILAGVAAGLAATAAKALVEKVYPPHPPVEPATPHWAFGAAAGAAYGALAEFYPAASSHDGVNFGMTIMALTHESALSTTSLATQTTREKSSELASHIVFGLAAETTRRLVRKLL